MLPKKVIRLFTLFSCSLVGVGVFQNCAEHAQFSMLESVDLASSLEISGEQYMEQLSHSGITHVAPTAKEADIDYSPVVMDRIAIVHFFDDIFGPQARSASAALRSIARDPNIFGGGCSFYRQSTTSPSDNTTFCSNTVGALSVKPLMGVTVLRQGRINQACHELSNNANTIKYILARIDPKKSVPDVSIENMQKLFALFYRARPTPSTSLYEAMAINTMGASLAGWKRAVYGICVSGHWQAL